MDYKIFLAEPNRYVSLYSLNSNSWRFISCQSSCPRWNRNAFFANGCFHWVAYDSRDMPSVDNPPFIMVFDIKSEIFRRIMFQECLLGVSRDLVSLRLALSYSYGPISPMYG